MEEGKTYGSQVMCWLLCLLMAFGAVQWGRNLRIDIKFYTCGVQLQIFVALVVSKLDVNDPPSENIILSHKKKNCYHVS